MRGVSKQRGDPEEPFTRRPDFWYLGNFTSCLLDSARPARYVSGWYGRQVGVQL